MGELRLAVYAKLSVQTFGEGCHRTHGDSKSIGNVGSRATVDDSNRNFALAWRQDTDASTRGWMVACGRVSEWSTCHHGRRWLRGFDRMHRHVDAVVAVHRIKGIVADILRFKKPYERQEIIHTTAEFLCVLRIKMRGQSELAPEMKRIVRLFWYERLHARSRRRTLRRNARKELLERELVTRIARSILDHSIVPKARVRRCAAATARGVNPNNAMLCKPGDRGFDVCNRAAKTARDSGCTHGATIATQQLPNSQRAAVMKQRQSALVANIHDVRVTAMRAMVIGVRLTRSRLIRLRPIRFRSVG